MQVVHDLHDMLLLVTECKKHEGMVLLMSVGFFSSTNICMINMYFSYPSLFCYFSRTTSLGYAEVASSIVAFHIEYSKKRGRRTRKVQVQVFIWYLHTS